MRLALLVLTLACAQPQPMKCDFTDFIALGDSISIDLYPAADVARRFPGRASTDQLGAVSLLVRNDDRLWPEFKGRDLRTILGGIDPQDLTADGATTESLLRQVEHISKSDAPTLVTITAGGNDLLGSIGGRSNPAAAIEARLRTAIARALERRPNATILVGTVYDPSDGTNILHGQRLDREAPWLADYNDRIRRLPQTDPRIRLADIHRHFLGHGLEVSEDERWYLRESIIEPSARGASEVRRVWLEALGY